MVACLLVVGFTLIIGAPDYDFETADSVIFRRSLANIHRLCVLFTLFPSSCLCQLRTKEGIHGNAWEYLVKGVLQGNGN